jgi:hypothetical protein
VDFLIGKQYGRGLSAYALKTIAIIAMVIDHVAAAFVPAGSALYHLMRGIGRLTAPIMMYFIAEGYHHTRDVKKYALRLGIFAVISHFPFYYFSVGKWPVSAAGLRLRPTSVIYTLFLALLAVIVFNNDRLGSIPKTALIVCLCLAATPGDGAFFVVLQVLAFEACRGDFRRQARAYCAIVAGSLVLSGGFTVPLQYGMFLVVPFLRQYNGTLGGSKHSKWFFYVFYPLHLLILGLLRHGM